MHYLECIVSIAFLALGKTGIAIPGNNFLSILALEILFLRCNKKLRRPPYILRLAQYSSFYKSIALDLAHQFQQGQSLGAWSGFP